MRTEICRILSLFVHFNWAIGLDDLCGRNESAEIHIIGFFPCTDPNDTRGIPVDNCDGIERIPIMKLALEEINERCDLLPGYRLVVDYANSACSSIPATYHLIQQTDPSQPTKLMILGTACSGASHLMGEIAQRIFNITQVAYTASDSVFGMDKVSYPRFYRMVPITEQVVDGYVALVKELNWNRVAVISHDDEFNINLQNHTEEKLQENNIHVILSGSFADDPTIILEQIKNFHARIIIAWIPHDVAVKFWCTVIQSRLAGPDFVWLLPGWFRDNWWATVDDTDCTAEEMNETLEHSIGGLGNGVVLNDPTRILVSNKDVEQFHKDLNAKNLLDDVKTDIFLNYGYVYDAVWAIALALNSSISMLEERGLGRLEDFTYDSVEMADVFTDAVLKVSFQGISGQVSYQQNGNRIHPSVQLRQYKGGEAVPVLVFNPSHNSSKFYNISGQALMWQGGYVPRDAPIPVILSSSLAECIIAGVVSSIGILSTIFFFVFNLCYSKHPVVKRSSYRLNSLILVGVFIGFTGTVLHVIKLDSDMPKAFTTTVCNARAWTSELAFVIAFGAMFAKVWRLYKVFFNKKMVKRKYLHDRHLFMMVAVIVAPTLVTLIVQVATFPLTLHTVTNVNEDDFSTEEIYFECTRAHEFIFLAIAYAENGILALVSVIVAYQTQRHSPKQDKYHKYNESAVINLTTIFAVLLSSVCQAVLIIFELNNVQDGILLLVTLRDCLWMHPMIYLLFAPKGRIPSHTEIFLPIMLYFQVYRACCNCGPPSDEYNQRKTKFLVASSPFYTAYTRASISSSARRDSTASILSERRPSYQFAKRCSDASIILDTLGTKREMAFSPIHEQVEEMQTHLENFPSTVIKERPSESEGTSFAEDRGYRKTESILECSDNKADDRLEDQPNDSVLIVTTEI